MATIAELNAWLAGTINVGPNGDGRYPLTDSQGVTSLVPCPAAIAAQADPDPINSVFGTLAFKDQVDWNTDITNKPPPGAGEGSVTSVGAADTVGLTWTGSPITGEGILQPKLSATLEAWHGIAPSSKANTDSPAFTGSPTGPTPVAGNNSTALATTAFVVNEIGTRAPTKTGAGASGTWGINISGGAAKLTTARTIGLTGAATGAGVAFNGTANITITVTGLNAGNLNTGTVPDARLSGTYSNAVVLWANVSGKPGTATPLLDGLMSAADKTKLDGILGTIDTMVDAAFKTTGTGGVVDWNDDTNTRAGVGTTLLLGSAANGPGPSVYFHPFNIHYGNTGNRTQLAIPYNSNAYLYMRFRYAGNWSTWTRMVTTDMLSTVEILASQITQDSSRRFMTDAERTKLLGIEENANNFSYTHPTTHPASMIVEDSTHRFMTDAERNKLGGIEPGANFFEYTHPATHPASMIVETPEKRFVTDAEKDLWNAGLAGGGGSGSGGIIWVAVNADTNILPNIAYMVDGEWTMTLPANLQVNQVFTVHAINAPITIAVNGNTIRLAGSGNDLIVGPGETAQLVVNSSGLLEIV